MIFLCHTARNIATYLVLSCFLHAALMFINIEAIHDYEAYDKSSSSEVILHTDHYCDSS